MGARKVGERHGNEIKLGWGKGEARKWSGRVKNYRWRRKLNPDPRWVAGRISCRSEGAEFRCRIFPGRVRLPFFELPVL